MEQGSIPERYLESSILRNIKKHNREMIAGAGIGNDFSCMGEMVTSDGTAESPLIAWNKAMNNFLCSAGECIGARIYMMLPCGVKESQIKKYMGELNALADACKVQIMGGHTEVSSDVVNARFIVTLYGKKKEYTHKKKNIEPGYDIVMTKYAGLLGTNIVIDRYYDVLTDRFAKSYLDGARFDRMDYSVSEELLVINGVDNADICYLHDVSTGGVYTALWQLGKWMDRGFIVEHSSIDIKQETIEVCEYLDINPYLLEGTGALLIVTSDGKKLVDELKNAGIPSGIIGKVTENKEKMIQINDMEKRCLAPYTGDELYHIINKQNTLKN